MNYQEISTKLAGFGVPLHEITPLKRRLKKLARVKSQYKTEKVVRNRERLLHFADAQRRLKNCEEALSTTVIGLLKKYTGYRVLVVWGSARTKRDDPAFLRMVEAVSKAGPRTIIIDGCGPGIMEAALEGARLAGAIIIGLRMVSDKAFETTLSAAENRWAALHTFCFDHHDFYSRVASFLAFADAVIIGKSGIGGTQEKSWVEGSIQCGMMPPIPVFIFSPEYWEGFRTHFKIMLKEGAVSEHDKDLIRFVPEGEETKVFERIDAYYAARPHLLFPEERTAVASGERAV